MSTGTASAGRSQTDDLATLGAEESVLFCDEAGRAYARIADHGQRVVPVQSGWYRQWLRQRYRDVHGGIPTPQAVGAAIDALAAQAAMTGPTEPVHTRVAGTDDRLHLDLGTDKVATVSPEGWEVERAEVAFRRKSTAKPLPAPTSGGSLSQLTRFLNVGPEALVLVVAWLVMALRPRGPYPVLILQGEAGSAKSTATKMLKALIDPTRPMVRSLPRSERDLAIAADGCWVLAFDNLSGLPTWTSDALCRLSTGGGFATRALYTDDEEHVFDLTRPVILNGLDAIATRQDLITRGLIVRLEPISDEERRDESEIWEEFEAARPSMLGALLDAASSALKLEPSTHLVSKPRLADFMTWVSAAEPALGWEPGTFVAAYEANAAFALRMSLDGSAVAQAVIDLVRRPNAEGRWEGTPTALFEEINYGKTPQDRADRAWPKNPQALSRKLTLLAAALRAEGIDITDTTVGRDTSKQRWVVIRDASVAGDAGDGGNV
jgi:hypothetical protein